MDTLPTIWVRAHPFGNPMKRDAHREFFDQRTEFFDELLPRVPLSYYHNHAPDGTPMGKPIAIGTTGSRSYRNPETGVVDGRWDEAIFFNNIPDEIKNRIGKAIENGTLRASPTVVPDFHVVDRGGHIKSWLTGSIAIFDAEGMRQPANPNAIGMMQMKALFEDAGLDFPNIKKARGGSMSQLDQARAAFRNFVNTLNGANTTKAADGEGDPALWNEMFGEDAEQGEEGASSEPKEQVSLEMDNTMKALADQNAALQRRLDTAEFEGWFGEMTRTGKALPAEHDTMLAAVLQFTKDDMTNKPAVMKSINPQAISRVQVYKATVEARTANPMLKGAQINPVEIGELPDSAKQMTEARQKELLSQSSIGEAVLRDKQNGKH